MTYQPMDPSTIPAVKPASIPTSTVEIQMERLVATCGVEAMAERSGREPISRVDWVLPNDVRHK